MQTLTVVKMTSYKVKTAREEMLTARWGGLNL